MTLEETNKFNEERARRRVVEAAKTVDEIKSNPEKELKEGRLAPTLEGMTAGDLDGLWRLYFATQPMPTFSGFTVFLVEQGYIDD